MPARAAPASPAPPPTWPTRSARPQVITAVWEGAAGGRRARPRGRRRGGDRGPPTARRAAPRRSGGAAKTDRRRRRGRRARRVPRAGGGRALPRRCAVTRNEGARPERRSSTAPGSKRDAGVDFRALTRVDIGATFMSSPAPGLLPARRRRAATAPGGGARPRDRRARRARPGRLDLDDADGMIENVIGTLRAAVRGRAELPHRRRRRPGADGDRGAVGRRGRVERGADGAAGGGFTTERRRRR